MPQRMTLFVTAILVIVVAAVSLTARTSIAQRAADECITKPNSTAPQGSHWYYRLDRATRKQCWYLGAEGEKVVRARQAGSRMKSSAPKESPKPAAVTPDETRTAAAAPAKTAPAKTAPAETASAKTAPVEAKPVETASAEAAPAPIVVDDAPAGATDPANDFSNRWTNLPKSADAREGAPAPMSNSYVDERSTAEPQDSAPLAWPIVPSADVPAKGRAPESLFGSDRMLAFLAGALGLAAIFAGTIFNLPNSRRFARRGGRKYRDSTAGDHGDPTFGDPLAAARRVDLASSAAAATHRDEVAPKSDAPKRKEPGHDLEASLQQLLRDWKRAAA